MIDFSHYINLPMVWAGIIAFAIIMYVILDGFDLGIGILFPFLSSEECKDKAMSSVAPFWDGNETWIVLGGGGLFAAFPLAYSILFPAHYLPIMLMLIGLIFRGVAFEFRFKARKRKKHLWDYSFHFGSLIASFMQGIILGSFICGVSTDGTIYTGGAFSWITPFSIFCGIAVIFGYSLIGACWLIMKTTGELQNKAREMAKYVLIYVVVCMAIVSMFVPFINDLIYSRWFSMPNILYLSILPIISMYAIFKLRQSIYSEADNAPFIITIILFLLNYAGFIISLWPYIVPFKIKIWEAAAANTSLSMLLIGTAIFVPVILCYTAYAYYVFRGKAEVHAY